MNRNNALYIFWGIIIAGILINILFIYNNNYRGLNVQILVDLVLILVFTGIIEHFKDKSDKDLALFDELVLMTRSSAIDPVVFFEKLRRYYSQFGEKELPLINKDFTGMNFVNIPNAKLYIQNCHFEQDETDFVIRVVKIDHVEFKSNIITARFIKLLLRNVSFQGHNYDLKFDSCLLDNIDFSSSEISSSSFLLKYNKTSSIKFFDTDLSSSGLFDLDHVNIPFTDIDLTPEYSKQHLDDFLATHTVSNQWETKIEINSKTKLNDVTLDYSIYASLKPQLDKLKARVVFINPIDNTVLVCSRDETSLTETDVYLKSRQK